MKRSDVELLSPAGDMECFTAAMNAGADAVYLGLNRFSARANARNFTVEQLKEALDIAHILGRKIYLTVNTLFKDDEIDELYDLLLQPYEDGVDGVIVQDIGVMAKIAELFPLLPVHISTQAAVTAAAGAKFLEGLNVTRIVPARELSLKEIGILKEESGLELETFIHGSLCYSYSGKCLMSSFIGGRSGNRGRCAQPCRLMYDNEYLLSLKDLCTIDFIGDLINAGISSFKIEGRMKSSSYVYNVTAIYRKYIDMFFEKGSVRVDPDDREALISLYTRGGNCNGYYRCHNSADMITFGSPSYLSDKSAEADVRALCASLPVDISCVIKKDTNAVITVSGRGVCAEVVTGIIPETAKNSAISEENVIKQLKRTGGTGFSVHNIHTELDDGLFIPNGKLNEIRRDGLEAFRVKLLSDYKRRSETKQTGTENAGKRSSETAHTDDICAVNVSVVDRKQFEASVKSRADIITIPMELFDNVQSILEAGTGKKIRIALPYVVREEGAYNSTENIRTFVENNAKRYDIEGFYVSNLEAAQILKESGYRGRIIGDIHLYAYNNAAHDFYASSGITETTVPVELNERELKARAISGEELIVYGHLPMMISANCIYNTKNGCEKKQDGHSLHITDRKGKKLFVRYICRGCTNVIYNSVPLSITDESALFDSIRPSSVRFMFTDEPASEVTSVLDLYFDHRKKNGSAAVKLAADHTKGHIKRGVE